MADPLRYPLQRTNTRDLSGYEGPIDVWDIDNTYLLTKFERLRDLLMRAFEGADDKRARPGAVQLMRGLRRGAGGADRNTPLYFVSASPPQLRSVLEEKMRKDGVVFDGIAFKDHLSLLAGGRLRDLRRHTPYKLAALLEYRCEWSPSAREWLYGDDTESDARIYSIYAEIRAKTLLGKALDKRLDELRVRKDEREGIIALADRANELSPPPPEGSVQAIYIFAASDKPPLNINDYTRVVHVKDALFLARILEARGRIDPSTVEMVAHDVEG